MYFEYVYIIIVYSIFYFVALIDEVIVVIHLLFDTYCSIYTSKNIIGVIKLLKRGLWSLYFFFFLKFILYDYKQLNTKKLYS